MWRDDAYLLDIVIAARKVLRFTEGIARKDFEQNEIMQNAVMRMLEVIGEAARRVSDEVKGDHPEIPWREMIGMRNRLIHEYFHIRVQEVWDVITDDIPSIISVIEPLVPPDR